MYVKIILSVMVIFGCGYAGILFGKSGSARTGQLYSLNMALKTLELNVSYLGARLSDALGEVCCDDKAVESMFHRAAELIENEKGLSVKTAWDRAVEENERHLYLTNEDMSIINSFIGMLGSGDRSTELSNIKITRKRLESLYAEARDISVKNSRLYKNCGFLIGAMAVLILF